MNDTLSGAAASRPMRIIEIQRDTFTLHDGHDEYRARALQRLLNELETHGGALAVGDWVEVETDAAGQLWFAQRRPPRTQIARRANDGRRQVLASNVDTALLVMGLDHDFNPRRMERYIAMVCACGVAPVVVLTKADVGIDVEARIAELRERLPDQVPIIAVNGTSAEARAALAPWLAAEQTLVLLGSSGAGKSTLTNTLTEAEQPTGGLRKGDGRGRHTTTARSMHFCEGGACIIDTPGLRTWRPDADQASLASAFDDIETLSPLCRFRNCRHQGEPGCAVQPEVDADRLLNYHKLLRDARRGDQTPLERIAEKARWKKLGKAGADRSREKRR
jgi:ribosome biogenesis GTPase